ncbi:MAG TPA: efflux RND transporter periplasmic adaptor subunit [Woeseiaceae bacterium]|nr:efflux RND transporter periplasmic adaptor subunit [Woeseiaceae bacterium]
MRKFFLTVLFSTAVSAADAPPVAVADAEEQPIVRAVRVSGTVTSPQAALLSPSVGGLVAAVNIDAGDRVSRGDVLVVLDAELETLELARRAAELEQARTALADARRRLDEAERVASASAIAETEIKSRRAAAETSAAALAAAEAAVQQQRAIVARHEVAAPFAGVVSQRLAEMGEWVNPGDGLVELVAVEGLRFDFRVPQEFFDDIDFDTAVELSSDAVPAFAAAGRIQAIVPVKDPGARTFLVRVATDDSLTPEVTPGMSAQGILRLDAGRTGLVVSRDALLRYPDGRQVVWVVDGSAELPAVRERQVETGLRFDGQVEILSGLDAGATVVIRGNEALQEGQAVSIRPD